MLKISLQKIQISPDICICMDNTKIAVILIQTGLQHYMEVVWLWLFGCMVDTGIIQRMPSKQHM